MTKGNCIIIADFERKEILLNSKFILSVFYAKSRNLSLRRKVLVMNAGVAMIEWRTCRKWACNTGAGEAKITIFQEAPFQDALFQEVPGGVLLMVKLTPKSSSNKIGPVAIDAQGQSYVKVYVTAVPENQKANQALIVLLAKKLKIAKSRFVILSGATDRYKRLLISAATIDTLRNAWAQD